MNIGEPFSWKPAAFEGASGLGSFEKLRTVYGRIVYINEAHRYFTAEARSMGRSSERALSFRR